MMKSRTLKVSTMLTAIVAAALVAQASPAWHKVKYNGQSLVVWGERMPNGKIRWFPDEQPIYRPAPAPVRPDYRTNGVTPSKLANDVVRVRASDPETLREATKAVDEAKARPCPGPNCPKPSDPQPERKPLNPFKRVEDDVNEVAAMLVAASLTMASVFIAGAGMTALYRNRSS